MNRHMGAIVFITLLSACVSTSIAPLDNTPFGVISNIGQLEGVYKNRGDGGPEESTILYLSSILWPDDKSIDHKVIDLVEVRKQTDNSLLVKWITR